MIRASDALDPALRAELCRDPDALLQCGTLLKPPEARERCTVVRLAPPFESWVMKRYNRRGLVHTSTHAIMRTRAAWCERGARVLSSVGIPTPSVGAVVERRIGPFRLESWLVSAHVEGQSLRDLARAGDRETIGRLIPQIVDIYARLGRVRAGHQDLKGANLLIDRQERLWLLDLDGLRAFWRSGFFAYHRRDDRARLIANLADFPDLQKELAAKLDAVAHASR